MSSKVDRLKSEQPGGYMILIEIGGVVVGWVGLPRLPEHNHFLLGFMMQVKARILRISTSNFKMHGCAVL